MSDEEDDDQGSGEISSDEDEPAGGTDEVEKEAQPESTPSILDPVLTLPGKSEQPANSFEEALVVPQLTEAGPSGTASGVDQEILLSPFCNLLFSFVFGGFNGLL